MVTLNSQLQSGPTVVSAQSVAKWYIDCTFVHCVLVKLVNFILPSERCQYECSGHEFGAESCSSRNNPVTPVGSINSIITKSSTYLSYRTEVGGTKVNPEGAMSETMHTCKWHLHDIHIGVGSFSLWLQGEAGFITYCHGQPHAIKSFTQRMRYLKSVCAWNQMIHLRRSKQNHQQSLDCQCILE